MDMARPPKALYAYMPGIIGSRAGNRHVSAGVRAIDERNTASSPMMHAAQNEAGMMCMSAG